MANAPTERPKAVSAADIHSIAITADAITRLEGMLTIYSEPKPGPAYLRVEHPAVENESIQLERDIMCNALREQIARLRASIHKRFGLVIT